MERSSVNLYDVLVAIDASAYLILICIALGIYEKQSHEVNAFLLFFIPVGIIQVISVVMSFCDIENLYLFPLYICIQILTLGRFYAILFERTFKMIVQIGCLLLLTVLCTEVIHWIIQSKDVLTWYAHFLSSIFFVFMSLILLVQAMEKQSNKALLWLHIGITFYLSMNALFFLFGNILLIISEANQNLLWNLNVISHILFLGIIASALWRTAKS